MTTFVLYLIFKIKKFYLITELCELGELAKWIKKQGPICESGSKLIMRQIVDAISYLHKHGIFNIQNNRSN